MIDLAETYAGKRVLITGGLGFIGSNLAHRLVGLDADVAIVDALVPGCGGNLFNLDGIRSRVGVHIGDISNPDTVGALIGGKHFIFNLAGHRSHVGALADPQLDLRINCQSHLGLLDACRTGNPSAAILFAGTRSQYGRAARLPVDESHSLHPVDINGMHKLVGEFYHLFYWRLYGLPVRCLRLTNTFGPRHPMEHSRQGFLHWFIRLAMNNRPIPIYGDGKQLRDFNYVDDVVQAMLLALATDRTKGRVFNLGGGRPISVLEAAEAVVLACRGGRIDHVEVLRDSREIEVGDYWADCRAFHEATGWRPAVPFEEGLDRTVQFYRARGEHYWGNTR